MRYRRLGQFAAALAVLGTPLTTFGAMVTTAPVRQAPAVAMPGLAVLVVALIGLGIYRIRTRAAGVVTAFVLVAGLSLFASLSYGVVQVILQGDACNMQTVHSYPDTGGLLRSLCPDPIRIVDIVNTCDGLQAGDPVGDPLLPCTIGEVLTTNQECVLQGCT